MKKLSNILIMLILISVGCDTINEGFTDGYNEDPNNPIDAPGDVIFRSGSVAMMLFMTDQTARQSGMWTQHYTGSDRQYSSQYVYTTSATEYDNIWTTAYVDALVSFKDAKSRIAASQTNVRAVIDLSEALTISTLAALFGDVPYTEALDADGTLTPAYDTQASVYATAMSLIDQAITDLTGGLNLPGGWDIHSYGGSAGKWLKFAYSLKARLHMHRGEYSEALSAASNGITALDGSEDLEFVHNGSAGEDRNLWYDFIVENRSGYLTSESSFAVAIMQARTTDAAKSDETARLNYFYDSASSYNEANTSATGAFGPSTNTPVFIAAETYLIMAEAAARTGASNLVVLGHLNNAREYWNTKFGNNGLKDYLVTDFLTSDDLLDEVLLETYLSLNSQVEAFTFMRRIDFGIAGISPTFGTSFPERFLYPQGEVDSNPNTPAQVTTDLFVPLTMFQ